MNIIKENLNGIVVKLMIWSLPIVWSALLFALKRAIDWLSEHYHGRRFENTIRGVYAAARLAVASQRTLADDLKRAAADGKLTSEERAMLRDAAMRELKRIAPDARKLIKAGLLKDMNYDRFLGSVIEDVVHEKK